MTCFITFHSQGSFLENVHQKISIMSKKEVTSSTATSSSELQVLLTQTLVAQATDAYVKLQSYDDVMAWQQTLREYRADVDNDDVRYALELDVDMDYIKLAASSRNIVSSPSDTYTYISSGDSRQHYLLYCYCHFVYINTTLHSCRRQGAVSVRRR